MAKRIFVTGATGFVGSHLVRRLVGKNYEVHILARAGSDKWRIADLIPKIHEHIIDLSETEELRRLFLEIQPEIIIHLATASIYSAFTELENEKEIIKTNFLSFVSLLNALSDVNYRLFINTGSSSEYGLKSAPMKESDICQPINVYGLAKLSAALYGQYLATVQGRPIATFRLFSPYGPFDDKKRLMSHVIAKSLGQNEIAVGNPEVSRDYIFIDDVIDLYLEAIENEKAEKLKGEIYNVGFGRQTEISQVVGQITRRLGTENLVKWNAVKRRVWEPEMWQADMEKTHKNFIWRPKVDLSEGLGKTINWFKSNLKNYKKKKKKKISRGRL